MLTTRTESRRLIPLEVFNDPGILLTWVSQMWLCISSQPIPARSRA